MLLWVEPFIWKICSVVGDLMTLSGLLMLLAAFFLLAYRGTEALIKKGVKNEDQDRPRETDYPVQQRIRRHAQRS